MKKQEFLKIRRYLNKTQRQLAHMLGISLKAVQSFEQGWRNIPCHVERQMLFLLKKSNRCEPFEQTCWNCLNCTFERRNQCPAWEYKTGNLCWFINGNICKGIQQDSWKEKMAHCRQCKVFKSHFPIL
ncbi:MAG: helix-turn-helix transcriptional regulator [Desulfobacteraceae bacterium]